MTEEFLHYIWQYGLYRQNSLVTDSNLHVHVVHPGLLNQDAGPDFKEARIKIGQAEWIGHVEIHMQASDWYAHKHQFDKNYDQVILHVVQKQNSEVYTTTGQHIPTIELSYDPRYYQTYKGLSQALVQLPCYEAWKALPSIQVEEAIAAMGVEGLQYKIDTMTNRLNENRGGLRNLVLQTLFRGFSFGKNQENYQRVAQSIDHKLVDRHRHNLFQLESLFFGQSRLIPANNDDVYSKAIRYEYQYLASKYELTIDSLIQWEIKKTRPGNHPCIRLAQLAAWLQQGADYFDQICHSDPGQLVDFQSAVSNYWRRHIHFGYPVEKPNGTVGRLSNVLLNVNVVLPLRAFIEVYRGGRHALTDWVDQLESLPPEKNRIIQIWEDAGFYVPNAFYSQTFLFVYKTYCVKRSCLSCRMGKLIISQ